MDEHNNPRARLEKIEKFPDFTKTIKRSSDDLAVANISYLSHKRGLLQAE